MIKESRKIKLGSVCCGCGGFDLGASNVGMETIWAIDIFKEACQSFKANFPYANVLNKDIQKIGNFKTLGEIDGLLIGVPCKPFSLANIKRNSTDPRNVLYKSTLKAIGDTNCKFFIFENVKGLLSMKDTENNNLFDIILNDYKNCGQGYNLSWKLIDCANVGVPQLNRYRIIIIGIRNDFKFTYEFPYEEYGFNKKPYKTLKDTIYHLRYLNQFGDYDTSGFSPMYLSRNRQKTWCEPAFTIEAMARSCKLHPDGGIMTKVGNNLWCVPDGCRKLSSLECKLLQTFPQDYIVFGNLKKRYEQIGNAVPPLLAAHICKPLMSLFA